MKVHIIIADHRLANCVQNIINSFSEHPGATCSVFLTGEGVKALEHITKLKGLQKIVVCELSLEKNNIEVKDINPELIIGGQFQNAELVSEADICIAL